EFQSRPHAGVRTADWKLVLDLTSGAQEVFDLTRDPGELSPIGLDAAEREVPRGAAVESLARALADFLRPFPKAGEEIPAELTEDQRKRLESLDYVSPRRRGGAKGESTDGSSRVEAPLPGSDSKRAR